MNLCYIFYVSKLNNRVRSRKINPDTKIYDTTDINWKGIDEAVKEFTEHGFYIHRIEEAEKYGAQLKVIRTVPIPRF